MATQAIRFLGPPGQTITLDVFTLDSDTAEQSALTCTEATNRKGLFVTANFTDTLAGRHLIVKKIGGTAIGNEFVELLNASATYDAESIADIKSDVVTALKADPDFGTAGLLRNAKRARQFDANRRTIEVLGDTQWRYTLFEDDAVTVAYQVDFNPLTGAKAVVA